MSLSSKMRIVEDQASLPKQTLTIEEQLILISMA